MSFALSDLVDGAGVPALEVSGITADSRAVATGDAFFALPGTKVHGNAFVAAAVGLGAAAVVTDRAPESDPGVPVIVVEDVRAAFARAAARRFSPQPEVSVAITGTNGKTSVTSFVRQLWAASGIAAAGLGTLGVETAAGLSEGSLTTPDPLSLHRTLGRLRGEGIGHVAMEASSHGLDQRRLDGLRFAAVGFTNLTRDHLDYHRSMESYRDAKLRLFQVLLADGGTAVVNVDDPEHGAFVAAARQREVALRTVGRTGEWFAVTSIVNEGFGQRVSGRMGGEVVSFHLPLTGAFQASNALVALAMATATGAEMGAALGGLERLRGAKGRLELVAERDGSAVFVDYAHTPDALENALVSLRPYATGRLAVVFGCGGDRDRGKRPLMGAIAGRLADRVFVTDDNPRTEDAAAIRSEVMAAVPEAVEVDDRRRAIELAVAEMRTGDVVLIAGKGHEDYQIVGTTKHHFSDHEVVADALKAAA